MDNQNTLKIKQAIIIAYLRLKGASCRDYYDLLTVAYEANECMGIELDMESIEECTKYVQRCLQLPDIHFDFEIVIITI